MKSKSTFWTSKVSNIQFRSNPFHEMFLRPFDFAICYRTKQHLRRLPTKTLQDGVWIASPVTFLRFNLGIDFKGDRRKLVRAPFSGAWIWDFRTLHAVRCFVRAPPLTGIAEQGLSKVLPALQVERIARSRNSVSCDNTCLSYIYIWYSSLLFIHTAHAWHCLLACLSVSLSVRLSTTACSIYV